MKLYARPCDSVQAHAESRSGENPAFDHPSSSQAGPCPAFEIKVAPGDDYFTTSVRSSPESLAHVSQEWQHAYCRVGLAVVSLTR
jgi:hypothetical protein